jgi:hypothetical protein
MTSIREFIRRYFAPPQSLPAGTYTYQAPVDAPIPYRLHLRLEADGSGILIINAATVLHLNRTAAEFAYHLVHNRPVEDAARAIADRYQVQYAQAHQDCQDFVERIRTLATTTDLDPVTYLDFERQTPYTQKLSAPYRLDCALTYRLPEGAPAEAAPVKRVDRELSTAEWQSILDKTWAAGIPHVIFTGGEPTLRDDLAQLIAYAEAKGQVSGLLSDGLRLANPAYLNSLLRTGLDHLLMIFNPDSETAWKALKNATEADLFVAVHLTVTGQNPEGLSSLLEKLAGMRVRGLSLSAANAEARAQLPKLRERAAYLGLNLVWDLPVPYSGANPIALETAEDAPVTGAGKAWLYVEPDGDVLPYQGLNHVLGNLLRDPWADIWHKAGEEAKNLPK